MTDPADLYTALEEESSRVLIGNEQLLERLTISLLTHGHVLLEGVPGVAKTTLANVFAQAIGLKHNRIQMTPDVVPSDIIGTHVYRENTGEFDLQRGPVFANLVVADEINRATPKTQSALLEAMQEEHVTIEGETLALPTPFMIVATQNPIEMEGTFELPEAQRDRFQFKLTVDLPGKEVERSLLDRFDDAPGLGPNVIETVLTPDDIQQSRRAVQTVHVSDAVKTYIIEFVRATRADRNVEHGASPRASLSLLNTTKARAAIRGRDYVIPDDVKSLAHPVLNHRLVLTTEAELSDVTAHDVVEELLDDVEAPGNEAALHDSNAIRPGSRN